MRPIPITTHFMPSAQYLVLRCRCHAWCPSSKLLQHGHTLGYGCVHGLLPVPPDNWAEGGRRRPAKFRGLKHSEDLAGGDGRHQVRGARTQGLAAWPPPPPHTWSIILRASSTSLSCASVSMV